MIVGLFDLELPSEHRRTSARIDEVTGPDFAFRGSDIGGGHVFPRQGDAVVRELNGFNQSPLVYFRAGFGRMIEQHLVDIPTCYLRRAIRLRAIAVLKIKLRSGVGTRAHDLAAVFFYEPGAQKI